MKQYLQQNQSVTMNGQLYNTLRLLQLSSQDLYALVIQQIECNPLLDIDFPAMEDLPAADQSDIPFDTQECYENMWSSSSSVTLEGSQDIPQPNNQALDSFLMNQIRLTFSLTDQKPAFNMLSYLDEAGYMNENLDIIARDLNQPLSYIHTLLKKLQQLEPTGIFARSLKECLTIQLLYQKQYNKDWEFLLNHLDWIAAGKITLLCQKIKKIGGRESAILPMINHLKTLNPKPAQDFSQDINFSIIPDFNVFFSSRGMNIKINPRSFPKVSVNEEYYQQLRNLNYSAHKGTQRYAKHSYTQAQELIKNLSQRYNTLKRIISIIVDEQRDFLQHGVAYLKVLMLKDVAQRINMHESTISRAINNKYVQTPQGIYPLNYFFSSRLKGIFSAESIKHALQDLINQETIAYSDQQLVDLLKNRKGVTISRRTVAKYRKFLKFPSSFQRKNRHLLMNNKSIK